MAGMLAGWLQDERDKASGATASATKSEQLTHVGEKQKALSDRRWNGCEIELDRVELFDMAKGRVRGSQVGRRSRGTAFRHSVHKQIRLWRELFHRNPQTHIQLILKN